MSSESFQKLIPHAQKDMHEKVKQTCVDVNHINSYDDGIKPAVFRMTY